MRSNIIRHVQSGMVSSNDTKALLNMLFCLEPLAMHCVGYSNQGCLSPVCISYTLRPSELVELDSVSG